jgi:hypothetical protein
MRLYGALDVMFAAIYVVVGVWIVPSRSAAWNVCVLGAAALLAAAGVGLLVRARWGRAVAFAACGVLLAVAAVALIGLVASSAYLWGVYGALGRGFAIVAIAVAALVVQMFALLPLFQLRFLLKNRA